MTKTGVSALIVAGLLCGACGNDSKPTAGAVGTSGQSGMTVTDVLGEQAPPFVSRDAEGAKRWTLTRQFYPNRGDAPAWIRDRKPLPQMDELIGALQATDREGIDPALYNVSVLSAKRQEAGRGFLTTKGFDPAEASKLDVWLTYLYIAYASDHCTAADLSRGSAGGCATEMDLLGGQQAVDGSRPASAGILVPRHPQYARCATLAACATSRNAAAGAGAYAKPKPGHPIRRSRERPGARGDDATGAIDEQRNDYGSGLQKRSRQRRHGLEPDAAIGPAVVARLGVPVERRIEVASTWSAGR